MPATQILTPRYPCLAKAFHAQSLTSDLGCQGVRTNAWSLLALIKHWYKAFQHSLSTRGEAGSEGGGCRLCLERAESERATWILSGPAVPASSRPRPAGLHQACAHHFPSCLQQPEPQSCWKNPECLNVWKQTVLHSTSQARGLRQGTPTERQLKDSLLEETSQSRLLLLCRAGTFLPPIQGPFVVTLAA